MLSGIEAGSRKDANMKDLIFHQAVRYEYAKGAVNRMRTRKSHSILEVGAGGHGNLAIYLPDDRITFLDLDLPQEVLEDPRFVIGDALHLPYADNSFDFVIALDVIEHILPDQRETFIASIHRVAEMGVILSMPHFSERNAFEDEILKSFYLLNRSQVPVWIDEHIDCTLPVVSEIIPMIKKQQVDAKNIIVYHGVRRSLMLKMLIMEAASSKSEQIWKFFQVVNEDYIRWLMNKDHGMPEEEAMKTYVVWSQSCEKDCLHEIFEQGQQYEKKQLDEFEDRYSMMFGWALHMETGARLHRLEEETSAVDSKLHMMTSELQTVAAEVKKLTDQKKEIVLQVVLITYNHAKYIRQTLETVLMQETDFNFNIIVADDCSTDQTIELIRQMEQTTDIQFVYLPASKNVGIMHNYKRAFAVCDARYVAVLEGDDLWTDKKRLQKHVDFLESHCECVMSFNRFLVKNFEEGSVHLQPRFAGQDETQYFKYVTGHDLAYNNLIGNFSTCVYRTGVLQAVPEQLYDMDGYDWLMNLMVSRIGYIGCLIQPMSIYRIHSNGVWSGQSEQEKKKKMIEAIDVYDNYTEKEFHQGFMEHKNRLVLSMNADCKKQGFSWKLRQLAVNMLRKLYKISFYLPPVFIQAAKLIIPKAVARRIMDHIA